MFMFPLYCAGLVTGFWEGWYRAYSRACGPAVLELMKQRSQAAKLVGLRP